MQFLKILFFVVIFGYFLIAGLCSGVQAEENQTLEDRVPKQILEEESKFLTLTSENDYFGGGTDRQYTNGMRLTYYDMGGDPPLVGVFFDQFVPTFDVNETTSVYYSLGHNLYTPDDITQTTPDLNDRPYAGFLYLSAGMTSITGNHLDDMEVTFGVVGPWAFGEDVQKKFHATFGFDEPLGWDYQLENEPGLILSWQRRWPEAYSSEFLDMFYFRISPYIGTSLGNVYTYAASGLTMQLTPKQYKWQSEPLRVRPAIPGNGFFAVPENEIAWSLFAGLEGRAMGRNIFLDGNTFRDSPSVDKRYFVADANAGVAVTYGRMQISYSLNWRSKEFKTQTDESLFGAVSVGYRF